MRTVEGWLRHVAAGGGETRLELASGDRLRLIDPEGGQTGEVLLAAAGDPPAGLDWTANAGHPERQNCTTLYTQNNNK